MTHKLDVATPPAASGVSAVTDPSDGSLPCSLPLRRPPLPVEGVLFDTGDVLYDDSLWHRWLFQLVSRMGLHTHYRAFFQLWQIDYLLPVCRGQRDYWDALAEFLRAAGLSPGQSAEVLAAGRGRYQQLHRGVRPFPHVAQTLATLSRMGVAMAAVDCTVRTGRQLSDTLERLGLNQCFHAVVTSRDLGHTPPLDEYYYQPAAMLNIEPDKMAFVGHDANELAGAKAAGLRTIAVNYDGDVDADLRLDRLEDLVEALSPRPTRLLAG